MQPIIGICGRMGAGKDTLAAELIRRHPQYTLWKFADALRRVVATIVGVASVSAEDKARDLSNMEIPASSLRERLETAIADVVAGTSYAYRGRGEIAGQMFEILTGEPYKPPGEGEDYYVTLRMTVGRLLQLLGTECFRERVGANVWVEALFAHWEKKGRPPIVIADVRFPNEATAVRKHAGVVLLVRRASAERADGRSLEHASERSLDSEKPDFVLGNDGTIEDLNWSLAKLWPRISALGQLRTSSERFGEHAEWLFELLTAERHAATQEMLATAIASLLSWLKDAGAAYVGPAVGQADKSA